METMVRGAVQAITHRLPGPVRAAGESLIGAECYRALVLEVNWRAGGCVRLAASKAIGVAILGAAAVVKVPQLLKLVRARSGAGVSVLAYVLETTALLVGLAYSARRGFPLSTYGETGLIAAQNVAVTELVLHYRRRGGDSSVVAGLPAAAAAVALAALLSPAAVSLSTLAYLQAVAAAVGVASKLPQIAAIYRDRSTGQLSAFAVFNYLAGSLARIFTTAQEVGDPVVLYGYVAAALLNAVIAAQMLYYWNAPSPRARGKRRAPLPPSADPAVPRAATGADALLVRPGQSSTRRRG